MVVRVSGVCISRANIEFLEILALLTFRGFFLRFEGVRSIDAIKALISQIFMAAPILLSSSKRLFLG